MNCAFSIFKIEKYEKAYTSTTHHEKAYTSTIHHETAYTRICTADDITHFNYLLIMCILFDIYFILLFTLCLLFSQGHLKKFKGKLMFRQIAQLLTGPHASNDRHIFTFKYM